jgi:hypothetical protein
MPEEVNSKAPAAGSTANRLGVPSQNRLEDRRLRRRRLRHAAGLRGPFIEVSGYDLPIGVPRDAPGNSDQLPENEFTPPSSALRLAQNDERKSEDDGRGDHGSKLGKYRPESARSKLQRLAPCSPTKIVHVGLHVATSCWAHRPATAGACPKGGRSTQGNNSPVNKRTVRPRRKIGAWHAAAAARRSTPFAVFPPWLSGLRAGERQALAAN